MLQLYIVYSLLIFHYSIEVFLNPFAKKIANTICDGIINLQINKSTCDFCQTSVRYFCLINDVLCMVYRKNKTYIYCIHLFMSIRNTLKQSLKYVSHRSVLFILTHQNRKSQSQQLFHCAILFILIVYSLFYIIKRDFLQN